MKTLAIFSPNQYSYSETFIQVHKNLPFKIKYYYGGYLPTALESQSFPRISLHSKIKKKIKSDFSWQELALIQSLKKEKVDCVLAEYGLTACESLKVIQHLKLPLVVHFHGFDASNQSIISSYREKYSLVFEYAKQIIVVSLKMKNDLMALGCPSTKINLAIYGPDRIFLKNTPQYSNLRFVAVGRFVDKKAPYLTLAAFKIVQEKYPSARLKFIGEGGLENVCKNLSKLWGLENCVEFMGALGQLEIREAFQHALAFVQHSVVAENGDSEGNPVAILEAQAAGLPVISTIHAGIPEVVINNVTGLLVNEMDVVGMANSMIKLIEDKGLAKLMGESGRKRILRYFMQDKNLRELSEIITRAMNEQQVLKN